MNSKAALCIALLRGEVVNIKTGFVNLGITNVPREVSRCVEKPFGVMVSRTRRDGKSRYGVHCCWVDYRLNQTSYNFDGVQKIKAYVRQHLESNPKTSQQLKQYKQVELILK